MSEIVLCALNARYIHSSLGARYLLANLGPLRARAELVELITSLRPEDVAERLLDRQPRIIGIGVYIWNAAQALALARVLRAVSPQTTLILGGPEVSHELDEQPLGELADYVIQGEGEQTFRELCAAILAGQPPAQRVFCAQAAELTQLELPYDAYSDEDLAQRVLYVETSRGCPYRCAFCLSALDRGVRTFAKERLFEAFSQLSDRGARHFKLVDRTFNLHAERAAALLDFFGALPQEVALHLEWVPERLPEPLWAALERFDPSQLQLEVGVQSMNPAVLAAVAIERDLQRVEQNLSRLAGLGVHLHVDLIAGLPGEDLESFAAGFDRLLALGVDEIQLGVLKRLRGAPIAGESYAALRFAGEPPYEILQSDALDFATLQQIKRLAYLWDRIGNSGNFKETLPLLLSGPAAEAIAPSPFFAALSFCDWVYARQGRVHATALDVLATLLRDFLVERGDPRAEVEAALIADYRRTGRKLPRALRGASKDAAALADQAPIVESDAPTGRTRQARHRKP
jgi:radical SAM superfamily enzyme YgiQ (UPF0313 family)